MTLDRLKSLRRRFRFWFCRKRGHTIVKDQMVFGIKGPDRLNADGTITVGDELAWYTIRCEECGR